MLESLRIRNFRGVIEGHVDGFRALNILTGRNGCGKVAIALLTVVLCEGRASDLPFLVEVFGKILACKPRRDPDFPLGRAWTLLERADGRAVALQAAGGDTQVLDALRATAQKLPHDCDRLGVVLDLDAGNLNDRKKAVAARLPAEAKGIEVTVIGVGDRTPVLPISSGATWTR